MDLDLHIPDGFFVETNLERFIRLLETKPAFCVARLPEDDPRQYGLPLPGSARNWTTALRFQGLPDWSLTATERGNSVIAGTNFVEYPKDALFKIVSVHVQIIPLSLELNCHDLARVSFGFVDMNFETLGITHDFSLWTDSLNEEFDELDTYLFPR